jgi:hypothetical protein
MKKYGIFQRIMLKVSVSLVSTLKMNFLGFSSGDGNWLESQPEYG